MNSNNYVLLVEDLKEFKEQIEEGDKENLQKKLKNFSVNIVMKLKMIC